MKFFLDDDIVEVIEPVPPTEDNAIVVTPQVGKRGEEVPDIVKEQVALDALVIGPKEAAKIHGVPESSASKYSNGKDIKDDDTRARVIQAKYGIQDLAVVKLMESLELLEPGDAIKVRDKVAIINSLGNLVDKISDKGNNVNQVHLHLHAPTQKKESDYEIIEG